MKLTSRSMIFSALIVFGTLLAGPADAWWWWSTPSSETEYPVVLVPGVTGFDTLLGTVDYFYGIVDELESKGVKVKAVALTGWSGVYEGDILEGHNAEGLRGPQLENIILQYMAEQNAEKVNIIAHSHGTTTSRYFMNRHPDKVASLTTIAGPHKGTPTADYGWNIENQNIQNVLAGGIDFLAGDLIAFISGNWNLIGTQDTFLTLNHFQVDGIKRFNQDFPCPALPYSYDADGNKVYNEGIEGWYGADASYPGAHSATMTYDDPITGEHREGYIHFFSWTGNIGNAWKATANFSIFDYLNPFAWDDITEEALNYLDVTDLFMLATNFMNKEFGYNGDADAFIPVPSARFGKVLNENYNWNHLDEINQVLGLRSGDSEDPRRVVSDHVNRLKNLGL